MKSESNVNKTPKGHDSVGCFRFFEHIALEWIVK